MTVDVMNDSQSFVNIFMNIFWIYFVYKEEVNLCHQVTFEEKYLSQNWMRILSMYCLQTPSFICWLLLWQCFNLALWGNFNQKWEHLQHCELMRGCPTLFLSISKKNFRLLCDIAIEYCIFNRYNLQTLTGGKMIIPLENCIRGNGVKLRKLYYTQYSNTR